MRLLLECFACDPSRGSECYNGWRWVRALAETGSQVEVLTTPLGRPHIEAEHGKLNLPNLKFHYLDRNKTLLKFKYGYYLDYIRWLGVAAKYAGGLGDFDIVHHITWGSISMGTRLWKLGKPTVMGPVGGGMVMLPPLRHYLEASRQFEAFRTASVTAAHRWAVLPGARMDRCHVLACNRETVEMARARHALSVEFFMDVILPDADLQPTYFPRPARDRPVFLWVGRMAPIKGIELTVRVFAASKADAILEVVGDGPRLARAKDLANSLGVAEKVVFLGALPHDKVGERMRAADVFVFNSLRDSVGAQLLEAMAAGLPIVCLDAYGAPGLVPKEAAIMVPVETSEQVLAGLAEAISTLSKDASRREEMGRASHAGSFEYTMDKKVALLQEFYRKVVKGDG